MASILSWISSFFAGFVSVLLLVCVWGALISAIFAVIGVLRRRCSFRYVLVYLCISGVSALAFHFVLWATDPIRKPDTLSTVLFWFPIVVTFLTAPREILKLLKTTWRDTNNLSPPKEARALKKELKKLMKVRNQAHKGERIAALKLMIMVEGVHGKMDQLEFMERGGWRAFREEDRGRVEALVMEYSSRKAEREALDTQMKELKG